MYITEISLTDYRKLGIVGYRKKRVEYDGFFRIEAVPVGDPITESEIEYAKSFKHKTVALFLTDGGFAAEKYYVREPATFCTWAGVEHVYSEKNRWVVKADSEPGALPKRLFVRVYLVHLED